MGAGTGRPPRLDGRMPDATQLLHTLDRARWFLVPEDQTLPEGPFEVQSFDRKRRQVDEAALISFEIPEEQARAWVDERVRSSFAAAGEAWRRMVQRVQEETAKKGRPVPDPGTDSIRAEDVLGMSPGELYTDPTRGREAGERLLQFLSSRLRSRGAPAESGSRSGLGAGNAAVDPSSSGSTGFGTAQQGLPHSQGESVDSRRRASESPPDLAEAFVRLGKVLGEAGERLKLLAEAQRARREAAQEPVTLRRMGFFRELRHGMPDGPSLVAARSDAPRAHEAELVAYLKAGHVLFASPGPVSDVLDPEGGYIGTASILTDGVWCWPADLPVYVERYHLALPAPFLEHVLGRAWRIPEELDLSKLQF